MTDLDVFFRQWMVFRQPVLKYDDLLEILNKEYLDECEFVQSVDSIPDEISDFYGKYYGWIVAGVKKSTLSPTKETRIVSFNLEHRWFVDFDTIQYLFGTTSSQPAAFPIGVIYIFENNLSINEMRDKIGELINNKQLFAFRYEVLLSLDKKIYLVENDPNPYVRPVARNPEDFIRLIALGDTLKTLDGFQLYRDINYDPLK